MFTNTEMLSYIYRALGTKVGKRVQIDQPLRRHIELWSHVEFMKVGRLKLREDESE